MLPNKSRVDCYFSIITTTLKNPTHSWHSLWDTWYLNWLCSRVNRLWPIGLSYINTVCASSTQIRKYLQLLIINRDLYIIHAIIVFEIKAEKSRWYIDYYFKVIWIFWVVCIFFILLYFDETWVLSYHITWHWSGCWCPVDAGRQCRRLDWHLTMVLLANLNFCTS